MSETKVAMMELWAVHKNWEKYGTQDEFRAAIAGLDWKDWKEVKATPSLERTVISLATILYPKLPGTQTRIAIDCESIPDCVLFGMQLVSSIGHSEHRFFIDAPKDFSSVLNKSFVELGSHAEKVIQFAHAVCEGRDKE